MKRYIVFIQDEWNNLFWIGEFKKLSDALPDINEFLSVYEVHLEELNEYASSFGIAFDTEIETKDENYIMVRGFILEE